VSWRIHYFASVPSTNARAKELADAGEPEGTVVLADEQTEGRGRSGRTWYSPPRLGIWASIVLRPSVEAKRLAGLGIVAAVGIADALGRDLGFDPGVKWPNDILAGGRKLGGVLVEAGQVAGESIESAIVGIGINVNIGPDAFPEELRATATSLSIVAGRLIDRLRVLGIALAAFEGTYERYVKEGTWAARERWRELSTTLGRVIEIEDQGQAVSGQVIDLSPEGALVLKGADGAPVEVWHGDVVAVQPG
jgi:BirA family biotin operon repressor/biotin-[acetyl-CoA-carboxylase] ligase